MAKMKIAKVSRQAQLLQILKGIASRFPGVSNLTFGGKTVVLTDFEKLIQTELDGIASAAKAKDAYAGEVQKERTTRAQLNPTLRLFKNYVIGLFGDTQDSVEALGDFGFSPRKARKPTVATKNEAQVQAAATRKARGTVGPKAKAKIKGTVPSTTPATKG
jgi:hypothetical protein